MEQFHSEILGVPREVGLKFRKFGITGTALVSLTRAIDKTFQIMVEFRGLASMTVVVFYFENCSWTKKSNTGKIRHRSFNRTRWRKL